MSSNRFFESLLFDRLALSRLGNDNAGAGLMLCSLPLPRGLQPGAVSMAERATACVELGAWPDSSGPAPRRLILVADGRGDAPGKLRLTRGSGEAAGAPPEAELKLIEQSDDPAFHWERHSLLLRHGGREVELVMGLRTGSDVHWWEACRLVVKREDAFCRVIEVGGAIPLQLTDADALRKWAGYRFPLLHKHNWLNGHIYARLYANGVCDIYAHHVNSKSFDDGLDLEDAVPVIGIRATAGAGNLESLCGAWDGSRTGLEIGDVRFDVAEVSRLATPEQPGSIETRGDMLVWQPYLGMELYGGLCPSEITGDAYVFHAEQRVIPRGMARTLRFSLSLNPDRSPAVARYLAPAWWYGLCEEFQPAPLLPVSNAYDRTLDACRAWVARAVQKGGFEDGSIPRHERGPDGHCEPGWEGEAPYGQFLSAWRTGSAEDYALALRAAYHFADVAVDHAAAAVRMHGYGGHAFALPMERIHAALAAYLETGDIYLLHTARSVLDNAYWVHKNSWPRMAVGRDGCFVRGAVLLYRYLGDRHYLDLARDAAHDVAASQRENGTFGDQGGGAGIHGSNGYITKPWMGLMAVGGLLDYLETADEDPVILATVKKFADWLMQARFDHDGVMGWSYQHDYNGTPRYFDFHSGTWWDLPKGGLWHQDYLARLLTFCAIRFDDPAYFDAWAESYEPGAGHRGGDHSVTQSYQYIPWVQARLWNAQLTEEGVRCAPLCLGPRTPAEGTVLAPDGPVPLRWEDGRVVAPEGVKVTGAR